MGNTFGQSFKITTFGESHGAAIGVVIDGVPSNITLDLAVVQEWLDRRKPGQSALTTTRDELDTVECLSGLENSKTLGGPITLLVRNTNIKTADYKDIEQVYRPSHSDYTVHQKYGITAASGGGRSSARETIARVAAGAIAWQVIRKYHPNFESIAWVKSVKNIIVTSEQEAHVDASVTRQQVENSMIRCPIPAVSESMTQEILKAKNEGDTVGGIIRCLLRHVPIGLGAPVFDKLEADLAKAVMSLPATKGFEIGSGFDGTKLLGSQHNDAILKEKSSDIAKHKNSRSKSHPIARTATNRSGGIVGGISNGETITMNVAFKPVSTIFMEQQTIDRNGNEIKFKPESGRHDPCVLPRAVPLVESMACIVIADHLLRNQIYRLEASDFIDP